MYRVSSTPAFVPPLLPSLVDSPPAGDGFLHEIKHDGFRTIVTVDRGRAVAFSRNGHDWSGRYSRIVEAAAKLRCRQAVIDGEAIVQDEQGRSDIDALRTAMVDAPHRLITRCVSAPASRSRSRIRTP